MCESISDRVCVGVSMNTCVSVSMNTRGRTVDICMCHSSAGTGRICVVGCFVECGSDCGRMTVLSVLESVWGRCLCSCVGCLCVCVSGGTVVVGSGGSGDGGPTVARVAMLLVTDGGGGGVPKSQTCARGWWVMSCSSGVLAWLG